MFDFFRQKALTSQGWLPNVQSKGEAGFVFAKKKQANGNVRLSVSRKRQRLRRKGRGRLLARGGPKMIAHFIPSRGSRAVDVSGAPSARDGWPAALDPTAWAAGAASAFASGARLSSSSHSGSAVRSSIGAGWGSCRTTMRRSGRVSMGRTVPPPSTGVSGGSCCFPWVIFRPRLACLPNSR
jgi:hypothetical protein